MYKNLQAEQARKNMTNQQVADQMCIRDSCNNVTEIPLVADNLGEAPQPHLQKVVSGDMQTVKVQMCIRDRY